MIGGHDASLLRRTLAFRLVIASASLQQPIFVDGFSELAVSAWMDDVFVLIGHN